MHSPVSAAPTRLDRKAVGAVVLGNALEFYDFTIYAFFAKSIGATFFPSDSPTDSLLASLALFGIGYVMRPVGGVLIGAFADRAGRKPAMLITIALMAIGMLMLAACPGTATIGGWAQVIVIVGRLIQGLALGGEVGPSTAFLIKAAPARHRGFVTSWQIASQGCAALFAGLFATVLTVILGDAAMADWGWRLMFGLGLLVVPVGLVIRSHLPETAGEGHDPASPPRRARCSAGCCAGTGGCSASPSSSSPPPPCRMRWAPTCRSMPGRRSASRRWPPTPCRSRWDWPR